MSPLLEMGGRSLRIPPPVGFLLQTIRRVWDKRAIPAPPPLADEDWARTVVLAQRNGWSGLLYLGLVRDPAPEAPASIFECLQTSYHRQALRTSIALAELKTIVGALEDANIQCLTFKGPVLAAQAYDDWTCREFGDLDLFVRPRDFNRALTLLAGQGYQMAALEPGPNEAAFDFQRAVCLEAPGRRFQVDLHWTIGQNRVLEFTPNTEGLFERASRPIVRNRRFLALSPEDAFLYLCHHAARHRWEEMRFAADLAALSTAPAPLDWPRLAELAARAGLPCERAYRLGLTMAARLFDAAIPEQALRSARNDANVTRCGRRVTSRLTSGETRTPLDSDRVLLDLSGPTPAVRRYLLRSLRKWLVQPNQRDERALRGLKPPPLVLRIVRPFRLLASYGLTAVVDSAALAIAFLLAVAADRTSGARRQPAGPHLGSGRAAKSCPHENGRAQEVPSPPQKVSASSPRA